MEAGTYIRGFGACMSDGFPHQSTDSFFHLAVTCLRQETKRPITTSMFTLGGFPITRTPKYLVSKCMAFRPDIVVLQFGATDLVVPLRRKKNRDGTTAAAFHGWSAASATLIARMRWQFQGLVGDILKLEPVTPVEIYLETMAELVVTLLENNIVPVVVSPFVFGSRRSDQNACYCAGRLKELLTILPKAYFVDAHSALDRHPRHRMLLADGGHLSLAGQRVVADELLAVLKNLVKA